MRALRDVWHRVRGWWLLGTGAALAALLAAAGNAATGLVAAVVVAVGGAIAGVLSERGKARLTEPSGVNRQRRRNLVVGRVDRLTDPVRLGVHPAARVGGPADRVPPFVERDQLPTVMEAVEGGGFVLLVGDSTAGKTRLAYEAMRRRLPRHVCVDPGSPDGLAEAMSVARERRPSVLWLAQGNVLMLPVARVMGGFGGNSAPSITRSTETGTGSGAGVAARGLGVFVLKDGKVTWRPALDVNQIILGGQVVAIVAFLVARAMIRARATATVGGADASHGRRLNRPPRRPRMRSGLRGLRCGCEARG